MGKYAKAIVAALAAGATVAQVAISDGTIDNTEWVQIGIAALAAVAVWAVPNKPPLDESVRYLQDRQRQP